MNDAATPTLENLAQRVAALEDRPPAGREDTLYQHAAEWLRMVNGTIWTLNSIFLVGSILALNTAAQSTVLPHWKKTAGWVVLVMCVVWFVADLTYTMSGWRARYLLSQFDSDLAEKYRLYNWPKWRPWAERGWDSFWKIPIWIFWLLFQPVTYIPIAGIAYLAVTEFILAR
jgi:hypothetical protein